MSYLQNYLARLSRDGKSELAYSIREIARKVNKDLLENFSFYEMKNVRLSGVKEDEKLPLICGLICEAADLSIPVFLLLEPNRTALQQQVLSQVQSSLPEFTICGEEDGHKFIASELVEPVVIVLKRNAQVLRLWTNIFRSSQFLCGNPLFILDQTDTVFESSNLPSNQTSAIDRYLEQIQNEAHSCVHLKIASAGLKK